MQKKTTILSNYVITIPCSCFTGTGRVILSGFKCTDRDGDGLTFDLAANPDDGSFEIDSFREELKVISE